MWQSRKNVAFFLFAFLFSLFQPMSGLAVEGSCVCDKYFVQKGEGTLAEEQIQIDTITELAECKEQLFGDDFTLKNCQWITAEQKQEVQLSSELKEGVAQLNQLGTTDVREALGNIIKVAMGVMGSIALVMFIYGGFTLMTGSTVVGGGATKRDISKAKSILVWSALGVIVILASYALVDFVFEMFR